MRILCTLAALTILAANSAAECAMSQTQRAYSPNRHHTIVLEIDGRFRIATGGKQVASGGVSIHGHHYEVFIFDSGNAFVIVDDYEGLTIYDSKGAEQRRFTGEDLSYWRINRWACHTEGTWLVGARMIDGSTLYVDVAAGPDATFAPGGEAAFAGVSFYAGQTNFALLTLSLAAGAALVYARRRRAAVDQAIARASQSS